MKPLTWLILLAAVTAALGGIDWNYEFQIIQWSFDNTTDMIYLGSSRLGTNDIILGSSSGPYSTGLVLHPTKVPASDGFVLDFFYGQSDCSARNSSLPAYGGDGFAVVFLKDLPTNAQVQSSIGTLGVGRIPGAYVFGYSSTYNEFYVCHWNEPLPVVQTPGTLRSHCQVFPFRALPCGEDPFFTFVSSYDSLEVYDGHRGILLRTPFKMDRGHYYLGFGFGNDNYYRAQELQAYSYFYRDEIIKFNLSETLVTNPQRLDIAKCVFITLSDAISLNYGANTYGSAYFTGVVYVDSGFVTRFTWTPYQCDEFGIGGDGFSFFLSKNVPSCVSYPSTLGIGTAPNTTFVGYSAINDKFYVCQWNQAIDSFYQNNSACVSFANPLPRLTCGQSYTFAAYYDNTTIRVFVENVQVLRTPLVFEKRPYFAGFSFNSGNTFYFKQNITDWILETDLSTAVLSEYFSSPIVINPIETLPPLPTVPVQSGLETPSLVYLGTALQINETIQLTSGGSQSGLVYFSQPLRDRVSFESTFTWTPSNCDEYDNGADGWTFFLAKNVPTAAQVESSAGGLLGIQNVPSVAMAAYSATFNEFWVANWTQPYVGNIRWESVRVPAPGAKYTCGGTFMFSVVYSEPNIEIRLNNQVMISAPIVLEPVPYYYGLSGATGGGYFQQDVTDWTFSRRLI